MEFISTAEALAQAAPSANSARASSSHRLEPLRHVDAGVLSIAYYEEGPANGPVVVLLHGFPFDIHSYVDVASMLASKGCRTIVPYLRGHGPTRFRAPATPRSGEQAAIGADLQRRLAALPAITVPAITLDGDADGVVPATDGTASAPKFSGRRSHHVIPHAGHNLPQEEPEAFAAAVMALIKA
jgi:pimeloyl-ACP methyl ester carboxylesterase